MRWPKGSKAIPLTQGLYAIVDVEDYERINKHKWSADNQHGHWYAIRRNKENKSVYMHREILQVPKGKETDHKNHFGLDNRKSNIRICTRQQNSRNRKKGKRKTSSRYKGVGWHKASQKWEVRIGQSYQRIALGLFDSEIEAAKIYDEAAKRLYGKFASINFRK